MTKQLLKVTICLFLVCLFLQTMKAQQITQSIRAKVIDKETSGPLIGVNVAVYKDSAYLIGTQSDAYGEIKLPKVPVGRVTLIASYVGYKKFIVQNIIVTASKEILLNIEMESSAAVMNEVTVQSQKKGESINEMAVISAHTFTVEETNRYAGSRGDPARMATNFAGVSGTDDSRNDIVIRGNSPFGLLYKLENVNIPNPTHFAVAGSTGGPVGMLNNKVLSNSDFLTGAFPAEYGNAIAGVFDIRMKNGNDDHYEATGQFGVMGAEVFAEGPFNRKNRSSFIFNYRYATLELLVKMGIDIGTKQIPQYQDFQFKLNFPQKNGGNISIFGLGGYSKVNLITSKDQKPADREIYSTQNQDEYFRSGMGVLGMNYTRQVTNKTFAKMTFAVSTQYLNNHFNRVLRHTDPSTGNFLLDSLFPKMYYRFIESKFTGSFFRNTKINARNSIRYGMNTDLYRYDFNDSNFNENTSKWLVRYQSVAYHFLFQPYIQWKCNINDRLTINAGIHGQWFTLNNSWSIEPRAALKYQIKENQSISAGVGLHSQMQPTYVYFLRSYNTYGNPVLHNKNLDFTRSFHAVFSYDVFFKKDIRIKAEVYYQQLFGLPVDTFASSYSILNEGNSFDRFFPGKLVNKGIGRNYGLEFTLEKFFTHNWFFMFSGSVFDARYRASNGKWYNSDFNNRFILNALGTKEFKWGKKRMNVIGIGGKITYGGGRRYTPYDLEASKYSEDPVVIDSKRNMYSFKNYFRFDVKLNYRLDTRKGMTHELGIDLVNITFQKNLLRLQYVGGTDPVKEVYQLGFLPLFYYRLDFMIHRKERA